MDASEPRIDFALPADLPEVAALCESVIRVVAPGYFLARLQHDPTILPEGVLVARVDGHIVSTVSAHALVMRYGSAEIPFLGIGNVVTDPGMRRRGLANTLLTAARELATARHMPLAMLSTAIPAFYEPLGYVPWERRLDAWIGWRENVPAPADPAIRVLDLPADQAAVTALHDRMDRGQVGPLVRTPAVWERQRTWTVRYPREDPGLGFVAAATPGGPAVAYVRGRADPATGWADILEYAAAPEAARAVESLAATFAVAARAAGAKGIRLPVGCESLSGALARHALVRSTELHADMMAAILNPTALLASILPELTLRAGMLKLPPGQFALSIGGSVLRLAVGSGTAAMDRPAVLPRDCAVASLDDAGWVEVLLGVHPFSTRRFAQDSTVGDAEVNLLDALFPRRDSLFWGSDAF